MEEMFENIKTKNDEDIAKLQEKFNELLQSQQFEEVEEEDEEADQKEKKNNDNEVGDENENKEVIMQDERLSTVEAERMLISNDTKRKNRHKVIDKIAATYN